MTSADRPRISIAGRCAASRTHRGISRAMAMATLAAIVSSCGNNKVPQQGDPQPISVMTRNLYLGTDLTPLFSALNLQELGVLAGAAWDQIQNSRFEERAVLLAAEVADAQADVLALQEVSLYRTQTPSDWQSDGPVANASDVALDFLEILLGALAARGQRYQVADQGVFTDQEVPATDNQGAPFDIRLADRNVTLVREGLAFVSGPAAAFTATFSLPVAGAGGATLTLQRGYVSTDVTVGDKTVRVVNSHLEVGGGLLGRIQERQAGELIAALAPRRQPVILAGDFNSQVDGSGTTSYAALTTTTSAAQGFQDAWNFRQNLSDPPGVVMGGTCCVDLGSPLAMARQRIDLVLFRGAIEAQDAMVIAPAKTPSGLWPSDHLGVVAAFLLR